MARRKPFNAFRNDKVHVVRPACATCIYRPEIAAARIGDAVIREARTADNVVICHSTLDTKANAVCGGFYANESTTPVVLAKVLGAVVFVKPPEK